MRLQILKIYSCLTSQSGSSWLSWPLLEINLSNVSVVESEVRCVVAADCLLYFMVLSLVSVGLDFTRCVPLKNYCCSFLLLCI